MQPPFKPKNSKWCSISSLTVIEYSKRQAKALIRLRICAGWSDRAYTTLLEISCHGSYLFYYEVDNSRLDYLCMRMYDSISLSVISMYNVHACFCLYMHVCFYWSSYLSVYVHVCLYCYLCKAYSCFPKFLYIAIFVIIIYISYTCLSVCKKLVLCLWYDLFLLLYARHI